jgi:ABC-type branched-subunit amino acid transport system ATPase component
MALKQQTDSNFVPARRNPFATEHVTRIPFRFEQGDWVSQLGRLRELDYRAAIVGPQGSGKTTLLCELERQLALIADGESIYVFLSQDKQEQQQALQSALAANLASKILLVDGIERLAVLDRLNLFRASREARGLIVTAHRPLRIPPFRLPTWIRTLTSELVLDYVLSELSMDAPDVRAAGQLSYQKRKGNLREVLRDLYDRHAAKRFR